MKADAVFTDKEHSLSRAEVFCAPYLPGVHILRMSDDFTSGFFGCGAAITPSSCYVLSLMEADERKQLLTRLYSKDALGLNIARLCIGSSDYSPEIYTYDDVENDVTLEHFSVERDERYVIPIIKEILDINPELYIFASPWTPPAWMKTGGSLYGGYMREAYVDCYADYIVKFIKAYKDHGINVRAVTPQNEVNTQHSLDMACCIWHPETEAEFTCVLKEKLKANGLDVKIWIHDHNFNDVNRVEWMLKNCDGLESACDGVAFHYYSGSVEQTAPLKKAYPDIALHFTEGGPRLTDNYDTDWCKWGLQILKCLKVGYSSFTGWNLMLDENGGPNVGPYIGICGGLVTRDNKDGALTYSGQYKAFCQIAPYIKPHSKIYPLVTDESFNLNISSFPKHAFAVEGVVVDNDDGKLTAIVVNPNQSGVQTQLQLGDKSLYVELHAQTIATVISDK